MMASTQVTQPNPVARQRKSHRKSRLGCGNCKLRSIKCDETKPACSRCLKAGFTCNFSTTTPSLQLAHAGAFTLNSSLSCLNPTFSSFNAGLSCLNAGLPPPETKLRVPVALPVAGSTGEYELTRADLAVLDRFKKRTVLTVGNSATRVLYSKGAIELSLSNPYLLHVFLSVALIHDTHLSPTLTTAAARRALAFHWYHGTVLFKHKLQQRTLTNPERDSLWAAAALLGAAAFAHMDAESPYEAWPLKEEGELDLDWLKMSDGKKAVWEIADPTRADSVFRPLVDDFIESSDPDGTAPIPPDALPASFYPLFNLTSSTVHANPYHMAATIIAQLLPRTINDRNVLNFLSFIRQLDTRYRRLLEMRDQRAMLLLAWWYAITASHTTWWLNRRALLEGQAICIYLERECKDERILKLLEFPRGMFEMVERQREEVGKARGTVKGSVVMVR